MTHQTNRRMRRILLVDDDPLVVKVYAERMNYEGWTVAIARDGWEACQEAKRESFDVILLDIRMPFHDGLDVLREIRNGGKNEDTPVWILTSLSSGEQIEDSLRLGADGVFHKSVTRPDDLVGELEKVFRAGKSTANRSSAPATPVASGAGPVRPAASSALSDLEGGDFEFESFRAQAEEAAHDRAPSMPVPGPEPEEEAFDHADPDVGVDDDRIFVVYVNPFLGDGRDLANAIGLDASYQCRVCGGQMCMRLRAYPSGRGHEIGGAILCSRCEEPA